jgi:murein DD-endopeptidase MepM/ murein hydrolase activator NlpD
MLSQGGIPVMPQSGKIPVACKAIVAKMQNIGKTWRVLLSCALLTAVILPAFLWQQPPALSTTAAVAPPPALPAAVNSAALPPNAKPAAALAATPTIWPVRGTVTSGFGWRISPFSGGREMHPGVDIAVATGTPVVAAADGTVIISGPYGGYGNLVEIDHGNGIKTLYGHNSQLVVQVGQHVKKGQVISYSGSTGESTGPHVHYEIRINNTPVDPMKYLVQY